MCKPFPVLILSIFIQAQPADLVIKNARIWTVDKHNPTAQAVAVDHNKIIYVGTEEGVNSFISADTEIIDANGKTGPPRIQR